MKVMSITVYKVMITIMLITMVMSMVMINKINKNKSQYLKVNVPVFSTEISTNRGRFPDLIGI